MAFLLNRPPLLAVLVLLSGTAAAEAGDAGFYLGASGALTGARTDFSHAGGTDEAEYDLGYGLSGFAGYAFGQGLRAELELGIRQNDISNIDTSITDADGGETRADTAFVNIIYDIDIQSRFTPYLGAGIGVAHVSHGLVQRVAGDTVHDDYTTIAGQAIAGVSLKIDDKWDAFADYRHVWTGEHATVNSAGVAVDSSYRAQSINLGLKRRF
jgi:opacity protein-like surface antigen